MSMFFYCKFRNGVECSKYDQHCETCGWNPTVEAGRIKDIKDGKMQSYLKINHKTADLYFRQHYRERMNDK